MITKDITQDPKLSPLFDESTVVLFQLFILETHNKKKNTKEHKIVYGWGIKSIRSISENKFFCGDPKEVYSTEEISYSIYRASLYNSPSVVTSLVNALLNCNSLKTACITLEIDTTKLKFDVSYISSRNQKNLFALRPLIHNEPNVLITRNFYEKYSLLSPYKNVPSVSLIVNNLNKTGLLQNSESEFYEEWQRALLSILDFLKAETTMDFTSSGAARFGNIEFINTQCSTEFEVHNVWFKNLKEKVLIDHKEVSSSKKVKVVIQSNPYTAEKKLLVNCYLSNGGQVILDACKEAFHESGKSLEVEFECEEQISQISVSIWLEENGSYSIWYKDSVPLIRTMHTTMGMIGSSGSIKSEWLTIIENSNNKTKPMVKEAEKISKASYTKMVIGGFDLDPWVSADREFSELIARIKPPKSEAAFFKKGWDSDTLEHGAISFLEWFKKITGHAQRVVIQDPYFDILGLEFLARTTSSDTAFTILTCTQIKSEDDDQTPVVSEPNRAIRIKRFIKEFPSVLAGVKLDISDLRSVTEGSKKLIHDRYIFVFENNVLAKGFHLSNSIQGATKQHPLLITPIPPDVLLEVNGQILETLKEAEKEVTTKIVPLVEKKEASPEKKKEDLPADDTFCKVLKYKIPAKESVTPENVSFIITKLAACDQQEFVIAWSTIGYFLAHSNYSNEVIVELEKQFTPELISKLSEFLKATVSQNYPVGFYNDEAYFRNSYHTLFIDPFEKSLESGMRYHHYLGELRCYGNWGAHYGAKLLITTNFDEYIKVTQFIEKEFNENKGKDLSLSPLLKLNTVIFNRLIEKLFWFRSSSMIEKCLKSNIPYLQALSAGAIISNATTSEPKMELDQAIKSLVDNLPPDERLLSLCKMLREHKRFNQEVIPEMETKIFESISSVLIHNYSEDRLNLVTNALDDTYYPLIEKKLTENIFYPLLDKGKIDSNKIFEVWSAKFFVVLSKFKTYDDHSGVLDLTGWSFCVVSSDKRSEFLALLNKHCKNDFNEIRKPFKKGSTSWQTAFEQLFLIQTVLAITILYNEANTSKIDEISEIRKIIEQIEYIKTQYEPSFGQSNIQVFANQIMKEYSSILI